MACESCEQPTDITCKQFLKTDCVYLTQKLTCTGVEADTTLTAALKRIDDYICSVKNMVSNGMKLINIGTGSKIYKGVNNAGESQLRTLTSKDGSITIVEEESTIDFAVNVDIDIPNATEEERGIIEIATREEVLAGIDHTKAVTPYGLSIYVDENKNVYSLQIVDGKVELLENGLVKNSEPLPTMGEYTDTMVNGFSLSGTTLTIELTNGESYSQDISGLLNFTQAQVDFTEEDTSSTSYIQNRNPNKTIYADYTLTASDNNYVIVIDSGEPVTITVPSSLPNKHTTGFIQKGRGEVTIANTDIKPEGFLNTIRGIGHQAYVEKISGTTFLFGNLNREI